jgi:hypothetical protein
MTGRNILFIGEYSIQEGCMMLVLRREQTSQLNRRSHAFGFMHARTEYASDEGDVFGRRHGPGPPERAPARREKPLQRRRRWRRRRWRGRAHRRPDAPPHGRAAAQSPMPASIPPPLHSLAAAAAAPSFRHPRHQLTCTAQQQPAVRARINRGFKRPGRTAAGRGILEWIAEL